MKAVLGRRQFLKNMAAMGLGIYVTPLASAAQNKFPLTVLLSRHVRNPGFLEGVAHRSALAVKSLSVLQPLHWRQFIQKHRGQRLIGLMDNASYVVFEAVLTSQGGRFLVTGHHAQEHQFITLPETAGIAAALDKCLSGAQTGYQLQEICHGKPKVITAVSATNVAQGKPDWASVTGACYAQIAEGVWPAGLPGNFSHTGSKTIAAQDALVSFVVKV